MACHVLQTNRVTLMKSKTLLHKRQPPSLLAEYILYIYLFSKVVNASATCELGSEHRETVKFIFDVGIRALIRYFSNMRESGRITLGRYLCR